MVIHFVFLFTLAKFHFLALSPKWRRLKRKNRWALAKTRSCKQITNMFTLQKRQHSDVDEKGELVVSWQSRWVWRWSSRSAIVQLCTGLQHLAKLHYALNLCITWPIALLLDICTAYPCTRFYTWYRHTLPPAAFYLPFSFTHFYICETSCAFCFSDPDLDTK